MNRIIFDEPAWWQRPRWQLAAALALAALATWRVAVTAADHEPIARQPPAPPPVAALSVPAPAATMPPAAAPLPAAASAAASSSALAPPPLSTMVAPGVHITPLSVPPGTPPVPAGPREADSEPEN